MPFGAGSTNQFCETLIFQEPTKNDLATHDFLQGLVLFTAQKQNVCDPFSFILAKFKHTCGAISRDKMPFVLRSFSSISVSSKPLVFAQMPIKANHQP